MCQRKRPVPSDCELMPAPARGRSGGARRNATTDPARARPAALLDDAALLEDEDAVATLNGREAMRDDDAGPVGEKRVDRALDVPLRRRIETRRRLVEDDETRVAEEHAREREQLRLAGGEAACEHLGVERAVRAVEARQRAQPAAEADAIEHGRDALVVDRRVEEGDVLAH